MTWCHRGRLEQITEHNFIRRRGVDIAIQRRDQRAEDDGIEGDPISTVGGRQGSYYRGAGREANSGHGITHAGPCKMEAGGGEKERHRCKSKFKRRRCFFSPRAERER